MGSASLYIKIEIKFSLGAPIHQVPEKRLCFNHFDSEPIDLKSTTRKENRRKEGRKGDSNLF